MRDACEELRVGAGDGGRLFRKAMMKTGAWGHGGIPIEYSRGMMDWVGSVGVGSGAGLGKARIWDHEWKRN
jgi:large subunit ribosomal protein L40